MQLFATAVLVDLGRTTGKHPTRWIKAHAPDIKLVLAVEFGALHPTHVQTTIRTQVRRRRLHNHVRATD